MIALLLTATLTRAEIVLEKQPSLRAEVVVLVSDQGEPRAGETVRVTHRPGLHGETEVAIGITDSRGRVRWKPTVSGVAEIRAGSETHRVNINGQAPTSTWVMLLTSSLLGIGALIGGLRRRARRRE